MKIDVKRFLDLSAMLSDVPGLQIVAPINEHMIKLATDEFNAATFADLFERQHGFAPGEAVIALMELPTRIELQWCCGDVQGELRLHNPDIAIANPIDASYRDQLGRNMSRFAALDMVSDIAGPFFVLYDPQTVDETGLILFDGKLSAPLELTADSYAEMAARLWAIDGWQFLFSTLPTSAPLREALREGFALVSRHSQDERLSEIGAKLAMLRQP